MVDPTWCTLQLLVHIEGKLSDRRETKDMCRSIVEKTRRNKSVIK